MGEEKGGSLFKTTRLIWCSWMVARVRCVMPVGSSKKSKKNRVGLRKP